MLNGTTLDDPAEKINTERDSNSIGLLFPLQVGWGKVGPFQNALVVQVEEHVVFVHGSSACRLDHAIQTVQSRRVRTHR